MMNETITIPNIDLIKEKVSIVNTKQKKENEFSVILSLTESRDLFKIIRYIERNISNLPNKIQDEVLEIINNNI